jgi:hypothetical protein
MNSECASHFKQLSEKVPRRPWKLLNKRLRKKAWAVYGCLNCMLSSEPVGHTLKTTNTGRPVRSTMPYAVAKLTARL